MSLKKIAGSTMWQLTSQSIAMIVGLLSVKLVTTALNQSLVGNYQTVYAYLQIFGIIADFGLYAIAVREVSRAKNPEVTLGSIFLLRLCITIISLGSAVILAWSYPLPQPLPLGITIAIFVPFFTLLAGMFRTMFQVHYKMHYVCIAEIIGKTVPMLLIASMVVMGARESDSVSLYYLLLAFGGAGSFLLLILSAFFARSLLEGSLQFSKQEFFRIAKLAAPFGLAFLFTTIYRQFDITLIALLRPHDYDIQNAYYGVVMRLTEMGFLLPTFILNSALPIITQKREEGSDPSALLGNVLIGLLILGSTFSLVSFFWARPIVLLLTRESYLSTSTSAGSDTALQLLSFPMFLGMIITFCFYLLLTLHKWRQLLAAIIAAATISVCLNLMVIPALGFVGAGITSIITHLFLAIALVIIALRSIRVATRFDQFIRWGLYSLLTGVALWLSAPLLSGSIMTIGAGILLLILLFVLLRALRFLPHL